MLSAIQDHWLIDAERVPSPNFDDRPDGRIDLLVIHSISLPPGEFGGPYIEQLFTNKLVPEFHPYFREIAQLKVSAHLLIRRNGELIQFVPFDKRAWHAGASCYGDESNCNDFSIGIELEGTDDQAYDKRQYTRLAEVTRLLIEHYPAISEERITGHSDIAPQRKTDPGPGFDWQLYRQLLTVWPGSTRSE